MYIAKLNHMKIYYFQHVSPLPRLPAWRKMGSHPRPWWRWQNCFGVPPPIISFITFSPMFTFTMRWETSGTVLTMRSVRSGKAGDGRWGRPGHQVWEYLLQAPGQSRIHSKTPFQKWEESLSYTNTAGTGWREDGEILLKHFIEGKFYEHCSRCWI